MACPAESPRGMSATGCIASEVRAMRVVPYMFKDNEQFGSGRKEGSYSISEIFAELVRRCLDRIVALAKSVVRLFSCFRTDTVKLAQKSFLSEEEVMRVLNDGNPLARLELAWNNTVSRETLSHLLRDPDRTVSAVARRRLIKVTDEELKIPQL